MNIPTHRISGCLILTLLTALTAAAQSVRLAGKITERTGLPVSGARVTVRPTGAPESQKPFETDTDPTGAFSLALPAAAPYDIVIDRQGFFVHRIAAMQIAGPVLELMVALDGIHELRTSIEVSSPKGSFDMERTAPQDTLSSKTLYDIPFPNQNSLRSGLRMLPGLVQDSRGGIHIFGAAEEQTHHNFEGFQLNDPLTGRLEARMSIEAVESVDASQGQPGAEFGRGAGGTLSLHARKGDDQFRYSMTSIFPGLDTQRGTTLGSWTPRGNISGPWMRGRAWFFNTIELQYFNNLVPELPGGQNRSRTYRANDLLHNQINLTASNQLTLGVMFNYFFAPRNGLTYLDPRETTVDRRSRQWFGYIKDQQSFARGALLEYGLAMSRTFSREIPQGNSPYIVSELGRRGNYYANARREASRDQAIVNGYLPLVRWHGSHQFKAGGDFLLLGYEQLVRRTSILFEDATAAPLRTISFYGSGALSQENREGSLYLQDSWRIRESLMVEAGVRFELNQLIHAWNVSPRLGFAWSPAGSKTRITGGAARIFDYTNLRTFNRPLDQYSASMTFDASGAPQSQGLSMFLIPPRGLRSPNAVHWNLGAERRLSHRLNARAQYLQREGLSGLSYINQLSAPQPIGGLVNFQGNTAPVFDALYRLTNQRRDQYRAVEFSVQQQLSADHEWMASYTRSSSRSNAVVDRNIDDPLIVQDNRGPLPWDAPHRLMSWGYVPTWWKDWAVAYLGEWRTGFPYSVQDQGGHIVGPVDNHRFPQFFELNLFAEKRMTVHGYRIGVRGGFLNVTGHRNPTVVNNVIGSPQYQNFFGGQRRALNFRIRFFGKA